MITEIQNGKRSLVLNIPSPSLDNNDSKVEPEAPKEKEKETDLMSHLFSSFTKTADGRKHPPMAILKSRKIRPLSAVMNKVSFIISGNKLQPVNKKQTPSVTQQSDHTESSPPLQISKTKKKRKFRVHKRAIFMINGYSPFKVNRPIPICYSGRKSISNFNYRIKKNPI